MDFNAAAYEEIMLEAGLNRFIMSVKQWVSRTNSKGIVAKAGRYGGTYAYKDIAFEFASWVSPQFKLYLIKEFERLKKEEQALLGWSAKRELAKINYQIHTDAIKVNLIPPELTPQQTSIIYASEADVLNMALFGMTAKQWRDKNPDKKGNIRDYASINELICLSNMENINAVLIEDSASTHICIFPSRYNLAYSSGSSIARAFKAHSEQGVVFNSSSALLQSIRKK